MCIAVFLLSRQLSKRASHYLILVADYSCYSAFLCFFKFFLCLILYHFSFFPGALQFPRCRVSSPRCWIRRPCRCSGSCPASQGRYRASSSPTAWFPRRSLRPRSSSPATSTHTPSHTSVSSVKKNTLCFFFVFLSMYSRFSFMQFIEFISATVSYKKTRLLPIWPH